MDPAFDDGASPEEVAQRYPTLDLTDVCSVFTYHLRHRETVQAYLLDRRRQAEEVRRENERRFPPRGVRERLPARRQSQQR